MLDWIFEGIVGWVASIVSQAMDAVSAYTHMIEKYFGKLLSMDQWEGCIFVKEWKIAPIPEEDSQDTICLREEILRDVVE